MDSRERKVYAAVNPDTSVRMNSSSGGIFTLLAEQCLDNGGLICGAGFTKNLEVEHRVVDNPADFASLRGSKYVYGRSAHTFEMIKQGLEFGREVLFSGCPCQVGALKKYIGGDYPNLLAVDVVCHGAPKSRYWRLFLDWYSKKNDFATGDIEKINFRDKASSGGWRDYCFTVRLKDGTIITEPYRENGYMGMFLRNFTLRDACFHCAFKGEDSKADLTIGDFWGIELLRPDLDDNKGVTLLIPHTAKGEDCCRNLPVIADFNLAQVLPFNPCIAESVARPVEIDEFRAVCSKSGLWPEKWVAGHPLATPLQPDKPLKKKSGSLLKRLFTRWK